ncbi:MAG: NADH-quinone oxidoreductase subunit A [marine bacterium B5-7]|nr:MAG: NADH-quinone oxidoreductase subunit A [marine bacterium B5-7]
MLEQYLPILIFLILGVGFGAVPLVLGYIVSLKRPDKEKLSAYECGFEPFDDARIPFDVRFYLVAILFIVFDLETAFLFPWAVVIRDIGWFGIGAMGIFLGLLIVGFAYEWAKGGLEWK